MYSGVYGHPANSPLADILTLKQHTIRRLNTYKQYDKLSRLTAIDWAVNNFSLTYNSQMSYACTYNSATQHTRLIWINGSYWDWTYDVLDPVTIGKHCWVDRSAVAGHQNEYTFDDIGN
jgi:hypothetical protein